MRFDFLLCSERSGSNLITQLLNAHPAFCAPFPSHLVLRVGRHAWRYGDLGVDDHFGALLTDVADYLAAMHSTWSHRPTAAELRRRAGSERSFGAVFRAAYEALAEAEGKHRVFVKDNKAATNLGFLASRFPGARYVFVVRDPRDMALVWRDNAMEPGGVAAAAACWVDDQVASLRAWSVLAPEGRILVVRFEDLVEAPEAELRRVCAHLGEAWDPAMLDFHRADLLRTNAAALSSWTDLGRPIDPTVVGRYRGGLSDAEVRYVEAVCGPLMPGFGYALDHGDPGDPDALAAGLPTGAGRAPDPAEVAIFERWYAVCDRIATRNPSPR